VAVIDLFKQVRIADKSKPKLVALRTQRFNEDVTRLSQNLVDGRITLGMWEEDMKTQLRLLHTGMVAIGKGNWQSVTSSDWGKVGNILKEQYRYLHGFAQDIDRDRETITAERIAWRAKLYGAKGGYTAGLIQAGDIAGLLPWIPRDGSTICLNNCRCTWEMGESPPEEGVKLVFARWTLHPAEHCETCVDRRGYVARLTVPEEMEVPSQIGGWG